MDKNIKKKNKKINERNSIALYQVYNKLERTEGFNLSIEIVVEVWYFV